jgi:hypothetical protein
VHERKRRPALFEQVAGDAGARHMGHAGRLLLPGADANCRAHCSDVTRTGDSLEPFGGWKSRDFCLFVRHRTDEPRAPEKTGLRESREHGNHVNGSAGSLQRIEEIK